ncbi:MAG: hypothetical protein C4519_15875 [Desulfobacteraceae bacterium]|nr:MAG: hypothetical protein C4519_15875 [Desulfobacteraceae bacterium]
MRNMKKKIEPATRVGLILLLTVSLWSMPLAAQPEAAGTTAAATQKAPALEGKERLSYALGMVLGNQLRSQSIEVDQDLYVRGLKDALAGRKTLLTETEAKTSVHVLQSELKRKPAAPPAAAALTDIKISFKLDPQLTRAHYLGDRWISPPTFTSTHKMGSELLIEARAQGLDALGRPVAITPQWIPADPEMVMVSPDRGNEIRIIVKRAGQTRLKVGSMEFTKELRITAMDRDNAMQVQITQ